jgi:hypothetical protein
VLPHRFPPRHGSGQEAPKKLAGRRAGCGGGISRCVVSLLSRLLGAHSPLIKSTTKWWKTRTTRPPHQKRILARKDDLANNKLLAVARKTLAAAKAGGSGAGTEGKVKWKGKKKVDDEYVVYAILYYT